MADLLNWPPSRGPNPHDHGHDFIPGNVTRKDMPKPPPNEGYVAEKEIIDTGGGELAKDLDVQEILPKLQTSKVIRRKTKKKVLTGVWSVWYQVSDVASLTLAQADSIIKACPENGRKDDRHFDDWWAYEPRTLWVDIDYPLARGVRLAIAPMISRGHLCKVCGMKKPFERTVMSPGYFLWTVAKEYERIYKEHEKYGVWGHEMSDLGFERIRIAKDGVVDLGIGS